MPSVLFQPFQSSGAPSMPVVEAHHSHKWNSTKCRGSARTFTWCQARWDLLSGSARRSKSSCRCLLGDRQWWHGSTGHTGDACRLCNVCRERSQICGTDKDERDQQEWMTEGGGEKGLYSHVTLAQDDVSHLLSGQSELTLADLLKHRTFKNTSIFSPLQWGVRKTPEANFLHTVCTHRFGILGSLQNAITAPINSPCKKEEWNPASSSPSAGPARPSAVGPGK